MGAISGMWISIRPRRFDRWINEHAIADRTLAHAPPALAAPRRWDVIGNPVRRAGPVRATWRALAILPLALGLTASPHLPAKAEELRVSQCMAIAGAPPLVRVASLQPIVLKRGEVEIRYVTHSTYRIRGADGVTIATDYAGYAGQGKTPDVVTMNHAHETHFTNYPDKAIRHVLRGWNPEGGPAKHWLKVGDFLIRNVTTDIRAWGGMEADGNSIFIFEIDGLCIGHLGHLHHHLTPEHYAKIGRLDVVMVPVDGSYTMSQAGMVELLKRVRASVILPMHAFGQSTLARFLGEMGKSFKIQYMDSQSVTLSLATLPDRPTVMVLQGL